ncbi:hypothetical protein PR003_g19746 [Phytophthora rubi]|uniref:Integrase zinc-binding domain-containing protein n=1 Tax=Phytophthora rubi TaxID=129364 RepID=A0A6A4DUA6_9STRA|nr:hypothetical protein PR002_g20307 [Phytophthora rubi]KAE9312480.1 hypothetical protein PR003_g19746 [Phytophthora rubi]
MPSPSEIQSRYGNTSPLGPYALYSYSAIVDDDLPRSLTLIRRRIGLFHELRFYGNKKHSRKSKVTEWEALCQSWGAFVDNFNRDPAGYRERVRSARERYERYSKRPKILRLHDGAVEAGIPCAVPAGVACERCQGGTVRLSERDLSGYTGISVPVELKTLREKLITQLSAEGARSTQPRAVGDYSSRSRFTPFGGAGGGGIRTPSPFPERRSSGRSAAVHKVDANAIGVARTSTPSPSLLDDVRSAYTTDADAKQLLDYFAAPSDKSRQNLARHLRARVHRYRVHSGLLLYSAVGDNADRIVVPENHELKLRITYEYHDAPTSGHQGREKTYFSRVTSIGVTSTSGYASTSVLERFASA